MRIATIIREELDNTIDANAEYEKYLNRKNKFAKNILLPKKISKLETVKFQYLYEKLAAMLNKQDEYIEKQWQNEILDMLKLIFPKYIDILKEVQIRDVYTGKKKRLDYLLVDYNGNVDIIEIKRPHSGPILTNSTYRDNSVPLRELSGTVMQVEKYIFWLNKWSKTGEEYLTKKCKKRGLPEIKITNPTGMIIMGRDDSLLSGQKKDFEIIKRKYKNIVDIITYDDLLRRLKLLAKLNGVSKERLDSPANSHAGDTSAAKNQRSNS
jgi:hypothetical protein